MPDTFKAVQVTEHVYWVGAIDYDVRDFHGYLTHRGSTYNAYLVMGEKIALIDTVKAPFFDEMMARIKSVIDPETIDVLISNHAEMDHSGAIPNVLNTLKPKEVYASKQGAKALENHFHFGADITAVGDSDTVSLGDLTIAFATTQLCHWPDSMVSYLVEDQVLFSQDGFGMHLATTERFADEIDPALLEHEAAKYYANILLPLSKFVVKTLEKWTSLNLPLKVLATDHGPIYRTEKDINWAIGRWAEWAQQKPTLKVVVLYDTMWGSTDKMARAIHEGLAQEGVDISMMPARGSHRSDIATQVLYAGALLVGTPTINNAMFPTVADPLTYIRGLAPKNMIGAAFGSYGWSGEGVKEVQETLTNMGLEMVGDGLAVNYVPDDEALAQCRQLGVQVAQRLKAKVAALA
ncbi:MAG: FprA family A-type flavoprotein [Planctomycetota bacterium]|jgi:flavorubredoxin